MNIFTDGGSRGNPGPSGAGGVIFNQSGEVVAEISEYLGIQTNNYAEYQGLILTLQRAIELGIDEVSVFMDSKLIVEQVNGKWKVKSVTLRPLYNTVVGLLPNFKKITFKHVYRHLNKHADNLVNKILDKHK
jgi:ribonuclease HI